MTIVYLVTSEYAMHRQNCKRAQVKELNESRLSLWRAENHGAVSSAGFWQGLQYSLHCLVSQNAILKESVCLLKTFAVGGKVGIPLPDKLHNYGGCRYSNWPSLVVSQSLCNRSQTWIRILPFSHVNTNVWLILYSKRHHSKIQVLDVVPTPTF